MQYNKVIANDDHSVVLCSVTHQLLLFYALFDVSILVLYTQYDFIFLLFSALCCD